VYDIVGKRNLWFAISAFLTLPGLLFIILGGLRPSIDFTGGTEWEVRYRDEPTAAEMTDTLRGLGYDEVLVVQLPDGYLRIRTEPIDLLPAATAEPSILPSGSGSAEPSGSESAAPSESAAASQSPSPSASASAAPSGSPAPFRQNPSVCDQTRSRSVRLCYKNARFVSSGQTSRVDNDGPPVARAKPAQRNTDQNGGAEASGKQADQMDNSVGGDLIGSVRPSFAHKIENGFLQAH